MLVFVVAFGVLVVVVNDCCLFFTVFFVVSSCVAAMRSHTVGIIILMSVYAVLYDAYIMRSHTKRHIKHAHSDVRGAQLTHQQ